MNEKKIALCRYRLDKAEIQIKNAQFFLKGIKDYIQERIK